MYNANCLLPCWVRNPYEGNRAHLLCCKMKAFWVILILVVGDAFEQNSTSTMPSYTSVSGNYDTTDLSTPNASTDDKNNSTTTANNIEKNFSVTSSNNKTTHSNTTENTDNISTRMTTTDDTKRSTAWTSNNGGVTESGTTPQCNTLGFKVDTSFIVAGAAIFLAVIWSFCLCCWYRRKLSRVKSQYDAECALSMHKVNGRKISDVKFSVGKVDKEFSSVSKNIHGEDEEPEDSTSDLYDVTDPDYEDADGTKTNKAKERSVDEEDSDYDLLNDDDKMKNRESEYACAEFKNSGEDLDIDTYDTTETCNRIICNKKHEHRSEKHLDENLSNVKSSDETEPQNQTKEMKAGSKIYDQVRAEENQEKKNKNSEDQATVIDIVTVGNKTAVENNTEKDKKTVTNLTKAENMATVENQPTVEGKATVENNTPVEDHATVESKTTVEDKSMVKNKASVENQPTVDSKATVEDKSTGESKASVENQATGENKAMIEDQIKIEDGASVGDNNGKMDKPCEKTTKSESDNDTKCVTFEYELVKIVQKPNDTQEYMQGTPTSV